VIRTGTGGGAIISLADRRTESAMTDLADRTVNAALRARFEHLQADYHRMHAGLADFQQNLAALTRSWQSADRRIKVTVNARGQLTRLDLAADACTRYCPADLAAAITQAVTEAAVEAEQAVGQLVAAYGSIGTGRD
jgi:DNA-binding protein YbaB